MSCKIYTGIFNYGIEKQQLRIFRILHFYFNWGFPRYFLTINDHTIKRIRSASLLNKYFFYFHALTKRVRE